jgi:hypothetical protein
MARDGGEKVAHARALSSGGCWKQAQLKARGFSHLPVNKEQVERAIADDLVFLAAHPTRARKATEHVRVKS